MASGQLDQLFPSRASQLPGEPQKFKIVKKSIRNDKKMKELIRETHELKNLKKFQRHVKYKKLTNFMAAAQGGIEGEVEAPVNQHVWKRYIEGVERPV